MFLRKSFLVFLSLILFAAILQAEPIQEKISDENLLELIQRQSFEYFLVESNPQNGLTMDKAHNFKRGQTRSSASIAATGFALASYAVGVHRNWIDVGSAKEKTRRTLEFFLNQAPHMNGFFYHFMDPATGKRAMRSEVSPIDTALFLAGALFAAEYYEDPQIRELAMKIYERVDWPWMLHRGKTFALAWSPETGFSKYRWSDYNESMILYLLAIGSPTHPIAAGSWKSIKRRVGSYGKYRLIQMPPLFTHQYSHLWIDFRNQNDGFADYFENSVNATLANRQFAIDSAAAFKSYGPNSWGLTASDGPNGYRAYGAPPGWADHDGTVAPTACGGSIAFTPKESIACLRHFYENLKDKLWGQYGFSDAFNLDKNWFSQDVLGIDQGPILLMIENYRSELLWKTLEKNIYLMKAKRAVGFKQGTLELPWPEPPKVKAFHAENKIQVDGFLRDWPNGESIQLEGHAADGFKNPQDLNAQIRFAWDSRALYFYAKVSDDALMARKLKRNIWQDDSVELFIDPEGDGFNWKDTNDFQIGFRPSPEGDHVETWAWFQDEDPSETAQVEAYGYAHQGGYLIEGAISWNYLGVRPKPGYRLNLSPALHDLDRDRSEGKVEWFFRSEEKRLRFQLGKIELIDSMLSEIKSTSTKPKASETYEKKSAPL